MIKAKKSGFSKNMTKIYNYADEMVQNELTVAE